MTTTPGSDSSIKNYLCSQKVLNGTPTIQVPQNHQAAAVAYQHLPWVQRILLQSLHTLQISAADIFLWNSVKGIKEYSDCWRQHTNSYCLCKACKLSEKSHLSILPNLNQSRNRTSLRESLKFKHLIQEKESLALVKGLFLSSRAVNKTNQKDRTYCNKELDKFNDRYQDNENKQAMWHNDVNNLSTWIIQQSIHVHSKHPPMPQSKSAGCRKTIHTIINTTLARTLWFQHYLNKKNAAILSRLKCLTPVFVQNSLVISLFRDTLLKLSANCQV